MGKEIFRILFENNSVIRSLFKVGLEKDKIIITSGIPNFGPDGHQTYHFSNKEHPTEISHFKNKNYGKKALSRTKFIATQTCKNIGQYQFGLETLNSLPILKKDDSTDKVIFKAEDFKKINAVYFFKTGKKEFETRIKNIFGDNFKGNAENDMVGLITYGAYWFESETCDCDIGFILYKTDSTDNMRLLITEEVKNSSPIVKLTGLDKEGKISEKCLMIDTKHIPFTAANCPIKKESVLITYKDGKHQCSQKACDCKSLPDCLCN
jgi:hypothetical protein